MPSRPTIIDVARTAGVSKSTVSRVIRGDGSLVSDEARRKVQQAVKQLGYERNAVAGSMRTNRTHTIALVIPDIANPFWPGVARGVQDALTPHNYALVLASSDWDEKREREYLSMARRNRLDGIIINPASLSDEELIGVGIPVVILGLGGGPFSFDAVGSDSFAGSTMALEHLDELGHRRIGLISGLSRKSGSSSRLESYIDFHRQRHISIDEQLIVECPFDQQCGHDAMLRLMNLANRPSAVFAANDILAIGALQAVHEMGLQSPTDVSIIGMDDIYAVSVTTPSLTTMAKQKYDTGYQAASYLLDRMNKQAPPKPRRHASPCRLIPRGSTAPLV